MAAIFFFEGLALLGTRVWQVGMRDVLGSLCAIGSWIAPFLLLEGIRFSVLSGLGIAQFHGLTFGAIARIEQLVWIGLGLLAYQALY
jgi:hypothetical protein